MAQDKKEKEKRKAVEAKSQHYNARIQTLTQLIMYLDKAGMAWPGNLFHMFVCTLLSFPKEISVNGTIPVCKVNPWTGVVTKSCAHL